MMNYYVFLGALITNEGGPEKEIRRRAQMTKTVMVCLYKIRADKAPIGTTM